MKLPYKLTSSERSKLTDAASALRQVLAHIQAGNARLESLRKKESELKAALAEVESRATSGDDLEAAIAVAGRREQLRLIQVPIGDTTIASANAARLLATGVVAADEEIQAAIGRTADAYEEMLILSIPGSMNRDSAKQIIRAMPEYRYVVRETNENFYATHRSASVEDALRKIDALLAATDFIPDYVAPAVA